MSSRTINAFFMIAHPPRFESASRADIGDLEPGGPKGPPDEYRPGPSLLGEAVEQTDASSGHQHSLGVVPRARADAVAGIDRWLIAGCGGAEKCTPGTVARTRSRGKLLAMLVGASQAPQVGTVAGPGTRDEETHRLVLC